MLEILVQQFEAEGKNAIDSPGSPTNFDIPPEEYDLGTEYRSFILRKVYYKSLMWRQTLYYWVCIEILAEGEERSLIERRSFADPKLRSLIALLIDWINDELANQRIIVKNLEDDLYDGQVLQKLLGKQSISFLYLT